MNPAGGHDPPRATNKVWPVRGWASGPIQSGSEHFPARSATAVSRDRVLLCLLLQLFAGLFYLNLIFYLLSRPRLGFQYIEFPNASLCIPFPPLLQSGQIAFRRTMTSPRHRESFDVDRLLQPITTCRRDCNAVLILAASAAISGFALQR